jgi:hypothetical protein
MFNKNKRKFKISAYSKIGIIFSFIGIIVIFISQLQLEFFATTNFPNISVGVTLLISGITNILLAHFEYKNWKVENLLRHTILDILMYDQIEAMRNIRYTQEIMLTIAEEDDLLKISCTHKYSYKNESLIDKNISVGIFNDIFFPVYNTKVNPYSKTFFEYVEFQYFKNASLSTVHQNDGKCAMFNELPDGRPHFHKNLFLEKGDTVRLIYSINNAFKKHSRMVWNIQELSQNVKIYISNKTNYDLSKFIIAINHPNRQEMYEINKKSIDEKSCLKKDYLYPEWDCAITFDRPFLPYQGFELKWDL